MEGRINRTRREGEREGGREGGGRELAQKRKLNELACHGYPPWPGTCRG